MDTRAVAVFSGSNALPDAIKYANNLWQEMPPGYHLTIVESPQNGGYGGLLQYYLEKNNAPFLRNFERIVWKDGQTS
ncbi:MAG: hypothetical protein ACREQ5_06165 [Candidatus Dormibacteria bacterium]